MIEWVYIEYRTNVSEYGLFLISFEMKHLALPFQIEIE